MPSTTNLVRIVVGLGGVAAAASVNEMSSGAGAVFPGVPDHGAPGMLALTPPGDETPKRRLAQLPLNESQPTQAPRTQPEPAVESEPDTSETTWIGASTGAAAALCAIGLIAVACRRRAGAGEASEAGEADVPLNVIVVEDPEAPEPSDSPPGTPQNQTAHPIAALPNALAREETTVPPRCLNYSPYFVEPAPSSLLSGELVRFTADQWFAADSRHLADAVFVRQGEGRTSTTPPLVSVELREASIFLLRNMKTGETLMLYHDSGARSAWNEADAPEQRKPLHPVTPRRGSLNRTWTSYEKFKSTYGPKCALMVETEHSSDRSEILRDFERDGFGVLPPLRMRTKSGHLSCEPEWNVSYRPEADELIVHLHDSQGSHVMHFAQPLTGARPVEERPDRAPDIVDRLHEYEEFLLGTDPQLESARKIVRACVAAVRLRNINLDLADEAIRNLLNDPDIGDIPRRIVDRVRGLDIQKRNGAVMLGLTQLAAFALTGRHTEPPVSIEPLGVNGLTIGAAFVLANTATGESLLIRYEPGMPSTPQLGVLGQDSVGYAAFIERPGHKVALLVEANSSHDHREVLASMKWAGVEVLPVLRVESEFNVSRWSVSFSPLDDQLVVHLRNGTDDEGDFVTFRNPFASPIKESLTPEEAGREVERAFIEGDIVDRLSVYKELLRTPGQFSVAAAEVVADCLKVIELRNVRADLAHEALRRVIGFATTEPGVPDDIRLLLVRGGIRARNGMAISGLTRLVEHLHERDAQPVPTDTV